MKYNTMFDVGFTIDHDEPDPYDIPVEVILEGLQKRVTYLKANPNEIREAVGVFDTIPREGYDYNVVGDELGTIEITLHNTVVKTITGATADVFLEDITRICDEVEATYVYDDPSEWITSEKAQTYIKDFLS